ncbi:putative armadillo-like helical protein [Helianthus annuus]|nr:putative armadillo-like helical protein [Helianthus annuus]
MDRLFFHSTEPDDSQPPPIQTILSQPLVLTDRIRLAVSESKIYKLECTDVGKHVDHLTHMLRSTLRFADSSSTPLYERPIRRIFNDVSRTLTRALTLVRKCRHRGIIRRFVSIVSVSDFRKVVNLLDVSIGDMKWLISVFEACGEGERADGGIVLTLPPIASNDPILAWVWSCIASMYVSSVSLKVEAATELCNLARDSDRNKMVIVEECGIAPLLKLLKDELVCETQVAGVKALFSIVNDQYRARAVFNEHGVPVIVQAFRNSAMVVQTEVAKLIARMAEQDRVCQEGFARENVIETLVTMLLANVFSDDRGRMSKFLRKSIGSAIEMNKQMEKGLVVSSSLGNKKAVSSSVWPRNKRDSTMDTSQMIVEFNTNCSGALWMLARGNVANCRKITETKGLLCLAKLIEKEKGELQINCLMTVMEITSAAEYNADIRRSAFKTSSHAAKAISDQLLRLINESDNPTIKIPAIKAIGHLARTYPARLVEVISPLVKQLCDMNPDVATESVITLGKFTCPENYLRAEHSKTIVDFEGVPHVLKMLRGNERTQYHALVLLCHLAMHAGKNEQFQHARVLTALEGADKSVASQYASLKDLVAQAVRYLKMSGY